MSGRTLPLLILLAGMVAVALAGCNQNSNPTNAQACTSNQQCRNDRVCALGVCMFEQNAERASAALDVLAAHLQRAIETNSTSALIGDTFSMEDFAYVFSNIETKDEAAPIMDVYQRRFLSDVQQMLQSHAGKQCSNPKLIAGTPVDPQTSVPGIVMLQHSTFSANCNGEQVEIPIHQIVWSGSRWLILTLQEPKLSVSTH